jgi:hypothetical protein
MSDPEYRDTPATLNIMEFTQYLVQTNPRFATALLAAAVENMASMPTEFDGKLIEVSVFDENGTPLYNLTESGEEVYGKLLM